jgi:DNA-binding MarR family transcriptional regulator
MRGSVVNRAMSEPILALEAFLPYRLNRLAEQVSRDFATLYKSRYGLTRPEWRLLATLGQYGSMTATAVGRHSSMHKTKVSRAVAALERRLWLTRRPDPQDRRVEHLTLTRTGEKVYRELVPLARDYEVRMLDALTADERRAVADGLDALERIMLA